LQYFFEIFFIFFIFYHIIYYINRFTSKKFKFGGIKKQKEKLENDGIEVIEYKVDLSKYKV